MQPLAHFNYPTLQPLKAAQKNADTGNSKAPNDLSFNGSPTPYPNGYPQQVNPNTTSEKTEKANLQKFGYLSLYSDYELDQLAMFNGRVYLSDSDYHLLESTIPEGYKLDRLIRENDSQLWEVEISYDENASNNNQHYDHYDSGNPYEDPYSYHHEDLHTSWFA